MTKAAPCKIGDILVQQGSLTPSQLQTLLEVQASDGRPLGVLAEDLLGVPAAAVETAWQTQYLSYDVHVELDRESIDESLTGLLNQRQAWQFHMLPLRRSVVGLMVVTTAEHLARASAFAWRHFDEPVIVLVADAQTLEAHLKKRYPWSAIETIRRRKWPLAQPVEVSAFGQTADRPAAAMPRQPKPSAAHAAY